MSRLTIRQAAEAIGTSERTVRRRIKDGSLPARKDLQGAQEVWTVDPGDLAAWTQATGRPMTKPGQRPATLDKEPGQRPAEKSNLPEVVIGQSLDNGPATAGNPGQAQAQTLDTDRQALRADLDKARQRERELLDERDWLRRELTATREALGNLAKALPPAPAEKPAEPDRGSWWKRLFGR